MVTITEALIVVGLMVAGLLIFAALEKMRIWNANKEDQKGFSLDIDQQDTVPKRMEKLSELEEEKKQVWNRLISTDLPSMGFFPDRSYVSEVGNGIAVEKKSKRICLLQLETNSEWLKDKTNLQIDTWQADRYVPTIINAEDIVQLNLFRTYPNDQLLMSHRSQDIPEQEVDRHPRLIYEQKKGTGAALDVWKRLDENCVIVENRAILDILLKGPSPTYHKLIFDYLELAKEWYDLLNEML